MRSMKVAVLPILLFAIVAFDSGEGWNGYLQWIKPPFEMKTDVLFLSDNVSHFTWYAAWSPALIFLTGKNDLTFTINCEVEPVSGEDKLNFMYFIDKRYDEKPYILNSSSGFGSREITLRKNVWRMTYNENTGLTVSHTFKGVGKDSDVDTNTYHCYALNRRGGLASSSFKIYDMRYLFVKEPYDRTLNPEKPFLRDESLEWACTNEEIRINSYKRQLKYEWFFTSEASVTEKTKGKSLLDIVPFSAWPVQILPISGKLYWPYMNDDVWEKLKGNTLFCRFEGKLFGMLKLSTTLYKKGGEEIQSPKIIYPPKKPIEYAIGIYNNPPKLQCNFKVGRGKFSVTWSTGETFFKSGSNPDNGVNINGNFLEIVGPMQKPVELKNYVCEVTWNSTSARQKYFVKLIDVRIPRLVKDLPQFTVLKSGEEVKINCSVESYNNVALQAVLIDGYYEKKVLQNGMKTDIIFNKMRKTQGLRYHKNFNQTYIIFGEKDSSDDYKYPYKTYPMQEPWTYVLRSSSSQPSQQVTCWARTPFLENEAKGFDMYRSTIVAVIQEPSMDETQTPSRFNCTDCSPCEEHSIRCSFKDAAYLNGLTPLQTDFQWSLESNGSKVKLTDYPKIFKINPLFGGFASELKIMPLKTFKESSSALNDLSWQNLSIRCHAKFFYPGDSKPSYSNDDDKIMKTEISFLVSQSCPIPESEKYQNGPQCSMICIIIVVAIILVILIILVIFILLPCLGVCLIGPVRRMREIYIEKGIVKEARRKDFPLEKKDNEDDEKEIALLKGSPKV